MDMLAKVKMVRHRRDNIKYLAAVDDKEGACQDCSSTASSRWEVELTESAKEPDGSSTSSSATTPHKSFYGRYLRASNASPSPAKYGRKVIQHAASSGRSADSSMEPLGESGSGSVKLQTRGSRLLRANGSLPPLRNSVTHDELHKRWASQDLSLWNIEVAEPTVSRSDASASDIPKYRGRSIHYHVWTDDESDGAAAGDDDPTVSTSVLEFKGSSVEELTACLREETGLRHIVVCGQSPINGNLFPLELPLPPPSPAVMGVVVVSSSSKLAKSFLRPRLSS